MPKPDLDKVPAWYHRYIALVTEDELNIAFAAHQNALISLLEKLPLAKWDYQYAEGKWTIKELVQHIIDAERIFCYRALSFARKDAAALPGFDEESYATASKANKRDVAQMLEELKAVLQSSALLFASFDEEQLQSSGIANGNSIGVSSIGFIIIGHTLHHINILKERYL